MDSIIDIAKSIVIFPLALILALILFARSLFGYRIDDDEPHQYTTGQYWLSAVMLFSIIGYFVYQSQFNSVYYVYACPDGSTTKCYKVVADYEPKDCEDTEYDNRGAHGGSCTDDYFSAINFPNTGYITFEYCDKTEKDKWTCYAEDRDDGTWNLQLAEIVKVKK